MSTSPLDWGLVGIQYDVLHPLSVKASLPVKSLFHTSNPSDVLHVLFHLFPSLTSTEHHVHSPHRRPRKKRTTSAKREASTARSSRCSSLWLRAVWTGSAELHLQLFDLLLEKQELSRSWE